MDDIERVIELMIADLQIPLKIQLGGQEEQFAREAAKLTNGYLNMYRDLFPGLTEKHYLAMSAFHFCYRYIELRDKNDTQPYISRLEKIKESLDACLDGEGTEGRD